MYIYLQFTAYMYIASAKIPEHEEAYYNSAFMGSCLTISHTFSALSTP